jgi:hypothetical protein
MKNFQFRTTDITAIRNVINCCGSLRTEGSLLDAVLGFLMKKEFGATHRTVTQLLEAAIPEVGEPYPKRATLCRLETDTRVIGLETPGKVRIYFQANDDVFLVLVDFGRDSIILASKMLATLIMSSNKDRILIAIRELADVWFYEARKTVTQDTETKVIRHQQSELESQFGPLLIIDDEADLALTQ